MYLPGNRVIILPQFFIDNFSYQLADKYSPLIWYVTSVKNSPNDSECIYTVIPDNKHMEETFKMDFDLTELKVRSRFIRGLKSKEN